MSDEITKAQEYLDGWKRAQADLINYKKDEGKRLTEFAKFSNEALILDTLDVIANLELATKHVNDEGLNNILKQFDELLKKYGVERIAVAGQTFNPAVHEAVAEISDGAELIEVRPGYTMHGKVIRPARVKNK